MNMVTFSIVSHNQIHLACKAISSICERFKNPKIILTINVPENLDALDKLLEIKKLDLILIENETPKGFGANHNFAFLKVKTPYFCVCNPDIIIASIPDDFLKNFNNDVAVISPSIKDTNGIYEDNLRIFPNLFHLVMRFLGFKDIGSVKYDNESFDWISAIFLICSSKKYRLVEGFDESFYMYYEDADICRKFSKLNFNIIVSKSSEVIHDARRDSRKKFKYMKWHIMSSIRILFYLYFFGYKKSKGIIQK